MNINKDKGITLVALLITVIIMLIIAGIAIYAGSGIIKEAKEEDVKTNMLLIQAEIKNYVEQAKFENKETIDGIIIDDVVLDIEESEMGGFYKIKNNMADLNLGNLNPEHYLISFDIENIVVDVYFVPGISDSEGNSYNRLSDMLE